MKEKRTQKIFYSLTECVQPATLNFVFMQPKHMSFETYTILNNNNHSLDSNNNFESKKIIHTPTQQWKNRNK